MARKTTKQPATKPEIAAKPVPVSEPKAEPPATAGPAIAASPVPESEPKAKAKAEAPTTAGPASTAPTARLAPVDVRGNKALTHEQIARRAYEIYRERGGAPGRSLEDWLQAEGELS